MRVVEGLSGGGGGEVLACQEGYEYQDADMLANVALDSLRV